MTVCDIASPALWAYVGSRWQQVVPITFNNRFVIAVVPVWLRSVGFCLLLAFFCWLLVEEFVNLVWDTAIFKSWKATSKFIGLYITSEHSRLYSTAAAQMWIFLHSADVVTEEGPAEEYFSLPSLKLCCKAMDACFFEFYSMISLLMHLYLNIISVYTVLWWWRWGSFIGSLGKN